jgi:hypothetical protein
MQGTFVLDFEYVLLMQRAMLLELRLNAQADI